jgi:hypothetical protein
VVSGLPKIALNQPTAVTLRPPLYLPAGLHCLDVVVRDKQGRVHDWGMAAVRVRTDLD